MRTPLGNFIARLRVEYSYALVGGAGGDALTVVVLGDIIDNGGDGCRGHFDRVVPGVELGTSETSKQ